MKSQNQTKNIFCGQQSMKGKYVLMEFTNLQPSYRRAMEMCAMISYMMARCEEYKVEEDKPAIDRFMKHVFGGNSDKYLNNIYDAYYKNNKNQFPDFVPEVSHDVFGEYMPSIPQWMNYMNYSDAKFHELRGLVSGLFGFKPSQDAIIHVHGVFDSPDCAELTKYRLDNAHLMSTSAELIPVEIGHTWLLDKYKDYRSNMILFNPSDPDLEILNRNRLTGEMNDHAMFKKRLESIEGRMSGEDLKQLKTYRSEIKKLQNAPGNKRPPRAEQKLVKMQKKMDQICEKYTKENEVLTSVVELESGTAVKKLYVTEATN